MRRMTIRNIDETVYRRLHQRARLNQRSLEAEVRVILDEACKPDREDVARRARDLRARVKGRYTGDATADIRADRER